MQPCLVYLVRCFGVVSSVCNGVFKKEIMEAGLEQATSYVLNEALFVYLKCLPVS
jgi:hypothetical protein